MYIYVCILYRARVSLDSRFEAPEPNGSTFRLPPRACHCGGGGQEPILAPALARQEEQGTGCLAEVSESPDLQPLFSSEVEEG